ncbi:MAG TPA: 16S rRNA (guanine(966)-N(2))-methyltransferase RsmD [Marinobacterium sp.]|nr:16S rRNA (guanine(966)-N(2))-methyltransferase RsmD [Marinobacterium sp.]
MLRIIGGQWRSRKLSFPAVEGLRPTPDRVRETLFNWLQSVTPAARCLDLFSGSGALSFEALSRGAASATLVDASSQACRSLRANLQSLRAQNAEVVQSNALTWLESQPEDMSARFDLVFIDPPFRKGWLQPIAELLESHNLLADEAYIYIEAERELGTPELPANWQLHREKHAGQVSYRLYIRN